MRSLVKTIMDFLWNWTTNYKPTKRMFRYFMEPEGSLPHSQQPSVCPYPGTD
jgi:hypothetical protein